MDKLHGNRSYNGEVYLMQKIHGNCACSFFRKKCNLYICFWMNEIECLMAKYSICVIVHVCASEYAFVYVSVNTNEPNCKTSILAYF